MAFSNGEIIALVGDEDCGVGLACWFCDRGGMPVAWYDGYLVGNPYSEADVPTLHTIAEVTAFVATHQAVHDAVART